MSIDTSTADETSWNLLQEQEIAKASHDAHRNEAWQRDKDALLAIVHRGDFETRRRVRDAYEAGFDAGSIDCVEIVRRIGKLKSFANPKDDPHGCTPTWNAALDKAIEVIEGRMK